MTSSVLSQNPLETPEAASAAPATPSAVPAPVPLVFGPAARRLFGWYYPAAPGQVRNAGVVLCPPIGYEALCTHASYRVLAERLAAAGCPALRFDYDGTGDSIGSDEDPDRVRRWLASIGFAIETLRDRSGVAAIGLFGVRLGATLAVAAAAERGDVQSLLLWAPCRTGRHFLREMRVLQAGSRRSGPETAPPTDHEEAGGFVFTQATVADLNRLGTADFQQCPAARALLIGRDDLPNDNGLAERLAALGTAVTQASWPGYAAMMRDAQDTEIPQSTIGSMLDWLGLPAKTEKENSFPSISPGENSAVLAAEAFTEEPVLWGTRPPAFGILTRPRGNRRRGGTGVLLLNVGANHHIGPNRMYVALARQLAGQGFPALRLDIPGVGDSARGAAPAWEQIYTPSAVQHVQEAISYLEAHLGADRFALIGLCSGAYMAYQTASRDPRVTTQILINPQTFEWHDGDSLEVLTRSSYKSTHIYLGGLNDSQIWKRLASRQIDVTGIARTLGKRLMAHCTIAIKSFVSLILRGKPFETHVRQTFRRIAERGTDTLFFFAAEDAGIEATALSLGTNAQTLRQSQNGWKNVGITTIENADHTFTQRDARETLLSLIVQQLDRRFPDSEREQDHKVKEEKGCRCDSACQMSSRLGQGRSLHRLTEACCPAAVNDGST